MRRDSAARIWQRIQLALQARDAGFPWPPLVTEKYGALTGWTLVMDESTMTLAIEHEGVCVEISAALQTGPPPEGGTTTVAGIDIGRILQIASCVAACVLTPRIPPPGLTEAKTVPGRAAPGK